MAKDVITPWHVEQVKSRLLKKGASKPTINRYLATMSGIFARASEWELLGHKDLSMTRRYAHLSPGVKREAVSVIDGVLTQSVGHALGTRRKKGATLKCVTP